jgi:hypothetical protein
LTDSDIPFLAETYLLPENVVSELVARLRLKGEASADDYPEEIRDGVTALLEAIADHPDEDPGEEVVDNAAFALMGAMTSDNSFIITPDGTCTINPANPPTLAHGYLVVAKVMQLYKLGKKVDEGATWMLGTIISSMRAYHGESFDPSQIAEMTEKSYNTIYTAEKVSDAYPPEKRRGRKNLTFSHYKEAFFQDIPEESKDLVLAKCETYGLGSKFVRDLSSVIRKMDDDTTVRNIRSVQQAKDLIKACNGIKVKYYILNEHNEWYAVMGTTAAIPTGRLVIDLKNETVRKDNGAPSPIKPVRTKKGSKAA